MKRTALTIVKEYARSDNPQIRRNAASGFAALRDEDSLKALVDLCLKDDNESVRQRSEDEIVKLDSAARATVFEAVRGHLENAALRGKAYLLLGRLQDRGITEVTLRGSLFKRFLIVWHSRKYLIREFGTQPWRKALAHGLLGTFIGLFAFLAFLILIFSENIFRIEDLMTLFAVFAVIAVVLAAIAARASVPYGVHYDPLVGGLAEALAASRATSLVMVLIVTLLLLLFLGEVRNLWMTWVVVVSTTTAILLFALYVASVRIGTTISFGLFAGRAKSRYFQAVVGAASGIVLWTIACVTLDVMARRSELFANENIWNVLWVALLPGTLGLALAFAQVDSNGPQAAVHKRRLLNMFASFAILLIVVGAAAAVYAPQVTRKPVDCIMLDLTEDLKRLGSKQVYVTAGCSVEFTVDQAPPPILTVATLDGGGDKRVRVVLRSKAAEEHLKKIGFDEGRDIWITEQLKPGRYVIQTDMALPVHLDVVDVLPTLMQQMRGRSDSHGQVGLKIQLIPEEKKEIKRQETIEEVEKLLKGLK